MGSLPAISGVELMKLLEQDGWVKQRSCNHGFALYKEFPTRKRVTVVPNKRKALPTGTLRAILSQKQTGLGRAGLERLIKRYGR